MAQNPRAGGNQPPAEDKETKQVQAEARAQVHGEPIPGDLLGAGATPATGLPPEGIDTSNKSTVQLPRGSTYPEPQPRYQEVPQVTDEQREQWAKEALEREVRSARTRGVSTQDLDDEEYTSNLGWIISNRVDDRGYQELDPRHPGGQMVVGGPAVDYVYLRSPMVSELLRQNLVKIVPEPMRTIEVEDEDNPGQKVTIPNPGFPPEKTFTPTSINATQPGREIELGRPLPKHLFTDEHRRQDRRQQARMPDTIPVSRDAIVPPLPPDVEREQRRQADARRQARNQE